jgi:hypothetical protein
MDHGRRRWERRRVRDPRLFAAARASDAIALRGPRTTGDTPPGAAQRAAGAAEGRRPFPPRDDTHAGGSRRRCRDRGRPPRLPGGRWSRVDRGWLGVATACSGGAARGRRREASRLDAAAERHRGACPSSPEVRIGAAAEPRPRPSSRGDGRHGQRVPAAACCRKDAPGPRLRTPRNDQFLRSCVRGLACPHGWIRDGRRSRRRAALLRGGGAPKGAQCRSILGTRRPAEHPR